MAPCPSLLTGPAFYVPGNIVSFQPLQELPEGRDHVFTFVVTAPSTVSRTDLILPIILSDSSVLFVWHDSNVLFVWHTIPYICYSIYFISKMGLC